MPYVRINADGKWQVVFVTKAEEQKIRETTLKENYEILSELKARYTDLTEAERIALFNTLAKHTHYRLEDYVNWKIHKK